MTSGPRAPSRPGQGCVPGALLERTGGRMDGSFPLHRGDPWRPVILPSARVPGLHPELSHWGCALRAAPWMAASRPGISCLLSPKRCLAQGSPRNRGEWSPQPRRSVHLPVLPTALPPSVKWVFTFPACLYQKPRQHCERERGTERP